MSSDDLILLVATIVSISIAYGLAFLIYRAGHNPRETRLLYLLFGIPGAALIAIGAGYAIKGHDGGLIALASGIGLILPLLKPVRALFGSWTPMDPGSPVDTAGLSVVLAAIGFFAVSYILNPNPADAGGDVSLVALVVQFVGEIAFAYILVGYTIVRGFREASARLGLVRPTPQLVGTAVALVIMAFIVVTAGGIATYYLQPDISKQIDAVTKEITSDVQSPITAAIFGLGAGAGEELLLRGALQPRYGLMITSILFALLHSQYGISFVLLGIFMVGVILGLERKYVGTTASIITHAIFNMIAVLI